jgi:hypothetical protein
VRAEAYQVVEAPLLAFDNRQIATRSDFNVGSEVSLYPFIPGWDFTYGVTVRAARGSAMDPVIAVYDADTGARLAVHDDLGTTDRETLLLGGLPAGVYYVDVYGYDGAYNPRYTLTSNVRAANARAPIAADRFEVNNTRARATRLGQIVATSKVAGLTLTRKGVDFYSFSLLAPGTATSDVVVSFENALGDIDVEILNSAGRVLRSANGERLSLADLPAGNYFLRVFGYRGVANPAYSIRFNHGTVLDAPHQLPYFGGPVTSPPRSRRSSTRPTPSPRRRPRGCELWSVR